jgi:dTMP kinase
VSVTGSGSASVPAADRREVAQLSNPPASGVVVRLFGSRAFFRLWLAMVTSELGDWLGVLAIAALAERVGGASLVGAVFAARIAPGLFFAPLAGVISDRFDRKRVMVICDIGRAVVLTSLPFINSPLGLVMASLALELFTLAWQPAKEASVPHLVPPANLTTANSLSVVAGYGTFPLGAALFGLLAKAAESLEGVDVFEALRADQEGLAFYVDALTFLISAGIIASLSLPKPTRAPTGRGAVTRVASIAADLREGWRFLAASPVVRAVNVGLATGLIGGGMLVPLGKRFVTQVLGAGNAGYGLFVFMLGLGTSLGVLVVSVAQHRLPKDRVFTAAVMVAGVCLFGATSTTSLTPAALLVAGLGVCAGSAYVLGFTLLHENVEDEFRGRIFSTLNTLVRMCLLVAFAGGPLLTSALDVASRRVFDRRIAPLGFDIFIPGIRLTMWLAASIMVAAGVMASRTLRRRAKHAA